MFTLCFVIAASFLPTHMAGTCESSQCPELSLLQTISLVRQSATPSGFFEDDIVVPSAVEQRTNYNAEALRQSQVVQPVVPRFDVGNHAVPLPKWALPDSENTDAHLSLSQAVESRQQASTRDSKENGSETYGEKILSARAQSQHALVPQESPQETSQEDESSSAQVDIAPAQADDHSTLEVLATEPPLAGQLPPADMHSTNEHDIAAQFVKCQEDAAAGEECMKAKMISKQSAPSPLLPKLPRLPVPVDENWIQDKPPSRSLAQPSRKIGALEALAKQTRVKAVGDQRSFSRTLDSSPKKTRNRQAQKEMNSLTQDEQLLFASQAPLQRSESHDRTRHPELSSSSKAEFQAEDLEKEANRLEEQQQRLLQEERAWQIAQLQQRRVQQQGLEQLQQVGRLLEQPSSRGSKGWLERASVSEVRDYFDAKTSGRNDVDGTHTMEASFMEELPRSRREQRIKPQLIPAKDELSSFNVGRASVSEVRDYFDASRKDTGSKHNVEASLVDELPGSRLEERIKPQLIPGKDELSFLNVGRTIVSKVLDYFVAKASGRNDTESTRSIEASLAEVLPRSHREERIKPQSIPAKDDLSSLNKKLSEMARLLKDDAERTKHLAE